MGARAHPQPSNRQRRSRASALVRAVGAVMTVILTMASILLVGLGALMLLWVSVH